MNETRMKINKEDFERIMAKHLPKDFFKEKTLKTSDDLLGNQKNNSCENCLVRQEEINRMKKSHELDLLVVYVFGVATGIIYHLFMI